MRRRELLRTRFISRRRSKICASDDDCAAGSSVGSIRIADAVGMMEPNDKDDPPCKRMIVSTSSPLHETASTADMGMSFDTSFNSSFMEIKSPTVIPTKPAKSVGWTSTPETEMGRTPEKDQIPDNGWNLFDDNDDEFAVAVTPSLHPFDDKVDVGAIASPVSDNDIDSFTRKPFDKTKTSQSSSVKTSSVHENKRLKDEIREAREEERILDAGFLFDESSREDDADEGTLDEGTPTTSFYENIVETSTVDEGTLTTEFNTLDECTLNEGTLATSFYEGTIDTGIVGAGAPTSTFYTRDEGTVDEGTLDENNVSYYSRSEAEWDDMTLESDFDSVTLGSKSPRKTMRENARNVKDAGPSSRTLRHALRHQSISVDVVTSTCPTIFEELMGTYEDANNAFSQVFNAFVVSFDDVDKIFDVISGVKEDLTMIYTPK
jgi:hypothetical protein